MDWQYGVGVYTSSRVPAAQLTKLQAMSMQAVRSDEVGKRFQDLSHERWAGSPEEMQALLISDSKRWAALIQHVQTENSNVWKRWRGSYGRRAAAACNDTAAVIAASGGGCGGWDARWFGPVWPWPGICVLDMEASLLQTEKIVRRVYPLQCVQRGGCDRRIARSAVMGHLVDW